MSFLLDTDICSSYLKGDQQIFNRFIQHSGGLQISVLTLAELYSWIYIADEPARSRREEGLLSMLSDLAVVNLDDEIARRCGLVRADLKRQGLRVATVDLLIACTALEHDLTMVTHNVRHFQTVPGLRIEDWLAP